MNLHCKGASIGFKGLMYIRSKARNGPEGGGSWGGFSTQGTIFHVLFETEFHQSLPGSDNVNLVPTVLFLNQVFF